MSDLEKKLTKAIRAVMCEVEYKRGGPERSSCVSATYIYRTCREALDLPVEPKQWVDESIEESEGEE